MHRCESLHWLDASCFYCWRCYSFSNVIHVYYNYMRVILLWFAVESANSFRFATVKRMFSVKCKTPAFIECVLAGRCGSFTSVPEWRNGRDGRMRMHQHRKCRDFSYHSDNEFDDRKCVQRPAEQTYAEVTTMLLLVSTDLSQWIRFALISL